MFDVHSAHLFCFDLKLTVFECILIFKAGHLFYKSDIHIKHTVVNLAFFFLRRASIRN